jgi:hypothetical protein
MTYYDMPVLSRTLELGAKGKKRIQTNQNDPIQVTSVMTDTDVGVRFEGRNGCRTGKMLVNSEETETSIFVDDDNKIIVESSQPSKSTVFLSIKTA